MGPKTKQLKNSEGADMALRIIKGALRETSSLALLGLTAIIASEIKARCLAQMKLKFKAHGARQAGREGQLKKIEAGRASDKQ